MLDLSKVWPEWTAEEKLGEGAYGSVYKCVRRERGITSYCAIKVITVPHDSSELDSLRLEGYTDETSREYFNDIVDSFANEIGVMESLKGFPNIVSVEDFRIVEHEDNVGWDIYIRMELLTSFKQYLENHEVTQEEVLKLGKDICTALEICEKNGIIHRDIKADNIFVDKSGNFKLGDFGVARQLERTRSTMSRKGTYAYMAPEVAINGKYDKRADIYSLGMVMYKLLNKNRDPFLDTEKQMIRYNERIDAVNRRLGGEELPRPVNADEALSEIILKACKFNKEDRYSSAKEMKSAIEGLITVSKEEPETAKEVQTVVFEEFSEEIKTETALIPAPSESPKINIKAVGIIVAAAAVIVAGIFGIKAMKSRADIPEDESTASTTQNQEVVHGIYESFLESAEAKKYFEVTPAFADYYTDYEEYENYVNGISSTSKKLDYFDLDADGTDECVLSVCFANPESINHYVFYVFDVEGETVKCVESANELYGGHRSLDQLQIYQQNGEYFIRKYLHDPHLRCGSVYKYNGKSLDFVESVYATDENSESYIFTNVYSNKYDLFNENAANYLAFPTKEKYDAFISDYGIKELTEEEYYKIVDGYDNNEVYHILGNEDAAPAEAANAEETAETLEIEEQGTLTETISWILYKNGLLSIEGTGDMPDFENDLNPPWYEISDKITAVDIKDGIKSIGEDAFFYFDNLTSATIPDSILVIGDHAFDSCKSLSEITIPNGVTSIGFCAFHNCDSIKSIRIPASVDTIYNNAFSDCNKLEKIEVSENNMFFMSDSQGVLYNKEKTCLRQYPAGKKSKQYVVPEGITEISTSAFDGAENLTDVILPDTLTYIGSFAFFNCSNIKNINIPESVDHIEACAFDECTSIESITIPPNTYLENQIFYGWTKEQTVYIQDSLIDVLKWDKDWKDGCNAEIVYI